MTKASPPEGSALDERLDAAMTAAREAGRLALDYAANRASLRIDMKNPQDFVTEADKELELKIRSALQQQFPDDGFVGEETGRAVGAAGYWVVDPIDGTANFMRGLPCWGISIAYVRDRVVRLGVIYDPPNDALYHAQYRAGAFRNDVPIGIAEPPDLSQALAILGVSRRTPLEDHLNLIRKLSDAGIDYRRLGSAAIGLAQVAEGVAQFYYEQHLNCWDALAGMLIAHEAGAQVIAPVLTDFVLKGGPVFAGLPAMKETIPPSLLTGPVNFFIN